MTTGEMPAARRERMEREKRRKATARKREAAGAIREALPRYVSERRGRFYVRYKTPEGKWVNKAAGTDLGQALELRDALWGGDLDRAEELAVTKPGVRLRELVDRRIRHLEAFYKPSTVRTYRTVSRHLARFFRDRPVESWSHEDLELYVRERQASGIATSTVNGELKALKATLKLAIEEKLIAELPFKIRMLREVRRQETRIFTREEIQRLLDAADPRTRTLLLIASATGLRVGEIRWLQWRDIDRAGQRVTVRAKEGWTPKTSHERTVYVSSDVIEQLESYRESLSPHNQDDDWVLQDLQKPGERWRESGNAFMPIRRAFEKAGLYRPGRLTHEIRRAVASTMLLNGTPIHVVREILGHAHVSTTELYAFTHEEAKKDAVRNALA